MAVRKKRLSSKAKRTAVPSGNLPVRRDVICFAAIFVSALALRIVYLIQIESIPLFSFLAGDGRTYDEWAQRIAAGDWLGQGVFYQAPLYPYFLGVLEAVFGHNLWLIRFLQIMLGAFSCGLIYLVGQKLFSRQAGIAAGIILAFYAPAIFFDGLIEKSGLDLILLSLLLFLLICVGDKIWHKWFAAGAVLALLGLSRENALILVPVVAAWLWLSLPNQTVLLRMRRLGLFFGGLCLVLVPVGLRNFAVGGEFKLTTSQLGPNFYIGNNPSADGTYGSVRKQIGAPQLEGVDATRLAEKALGRTLTAGEVSSYWLGQALEYIKAQPVAWVRLLGLKWLLVWNRREIEDSDDFYIYQNWSWLLALLAWFSHLGTLVPLAAVGALGTLRQWRRLWPFYAMIFSLAASIAAFYVFGRYRYPLVPLLALFAGAGIVETVRLCQLRAWWMLARALVLMIAVGAVINWPLQKVSGAGAGGYNNLSNAYYKQGNVDEAIKTALKAIAVQPESGVAHYNLGNLYAGQRKIELARHHFEEALRIYPNFADGYSNYGQLLAEGGDIAGGMGYFQKAIALDPRLSRAHLNLGVALAKLGSIDEAIGPLQQAARLSPDSPEASYYLGSIFAAQNRYAEAADYFYQALRIQPDFVAAHQSLAQLLVLQGKNDEARQHYQEAVRLMKLSRQPTPAGH